MSIARRSFVVLTLVAMVAMAMVGLWQLGYSQGGAGSVATDVGRIRGLIEYEVRDASGRVKEHRVIHNATLAALLNDARTRLGVDGAFTGLGNNDLYDNIQAVSSDLSGATPTNAQLTTSIGSNPVDGTNATASIGADVSGNYTVITTFTATGAATIEELQLTKGAATSGAAEAPGAWQNVAITLANGDTLQVTWTIDID